MKEQNSPTASGDTGLLIQASRVYPRALIDVFLLSDKPEVGTVRCHVIKHREDRHSGWLVSHYGSSPMPVKWSFARMGWVFDTEPYAR